MNLSAEDFLAVLNDSDNEEQLPEKAIGGLDPAESYFLALEAREKGFYGIAIDLARHCWKNAGGFIAERAAEFTVEAALETGEYASAEFFASLAAAEFQLNYQFHRDVAASQYWQHKDAAVLDTLEDLSRFEDAADDYELILFRAVSSYRLKKDDWRSQWRLLTEYVPVSEYFRRGWEYLMGVSDLSAADFGDLSSLINAKYNHLTGEYDRAEEEYRRYFKTAEPENVSEVVLGDLEKFFIRIGKAYKGAALLEEVGGGNENFTFAAARLYRRSGLYADAARCMNSVMEKADYKPGDRALWYSLDIAGRRNPVSAVNSLGFYTEKWADPGYFSDTLDNICTALAGRRRWDSIAALGLAIEDSGPADVYDRCRYISERAVELGWLETADYDAPYTTNYYRLLTGEGFKPHTAEEEPERPLKDAELYIDGLLRYRSDRLLDEIKRFSGDLSEGFLAGCAAKAAQSGMHLDSIRIMYQFDGDMTATGYEGLYPALYRTEIEKAAGENNIPVQLMFGLVWKESGFEHDIVSRSGAVGLSQLMPSTAEDVAGRQRRIPGDLTEPSENLALGSWYLDWLCGYVGNTAAAVLSYNGGPGRVKGWLRRYPDLPDDLLYEVVPVPETHNYGKKVLEASVVYGMLYYGIDPAKTLKIFF